MPRINNQNQQVIEGIVCVACSQILTSENMAEDASVCKSCWDENTATCESCENIGFTGWRHTRDSWYTAFGISYTQRILYYDSGSAWICEDCSHMCSHCDTMHAYESYADECCQDSRDIHNYGYKPDNYRFWNYEAEQNQCFYKRYPIDNALYMGIELEMEKAFAESIDKYYVIAKESYSNPVFSYFKEDGSLGDYGAELVTMPATLDAFMRVFPFEAVKMMRDNGARSFYYSNCGFHIHVSRSAFTPSHMYKFVKFQVKNEKFCAMVGQRGSVGYASWNPDDNIAAAKLTKEAVKSNRFNYPRYGAINFQNYDTLELRYFKGNLTEHGIKKNVQFVDAMYQYTKKLTVPDLFLHGYCFYRFMDFVCENEARYPELATFLSRLDTINCTEE